MAKQLSNMSNSTKDKVKEVVGNTSEDLMKNAVEQGEEDAILCNNECSPGLKARNNMLEEAVEQGDQNMIRAMNQHDFLGSDVRDESRAVLNAVKGNHPNCVRELASAGFDVDAADSDASPIVVAAREGKVDCARNLISAGCNVDVEHRFGEAPFLEAITSALQSSGSGEMDVAELLSDAGCNVNKLGRDGKSALHAVTMEGTIKEIQFLIKKAKVDLDVPSGSSVGSGYTALHMAIQFNDEPEVAQELINAGCSLNKTSNEKQETALHLALGVPGDLQYTYVNMLLLAGCRLDIKDCHGETVLHICKRPDVMNRLIDAADYESLSIRNAMGRTPLHAVIDKGFDSAVNELLDKNTDPNDADTIGDTCLHLASMDELSRVPNFVECDGFDNPTDFAEQFEFPMSNISLGNGLSVATYKRILDRISDIDVQNKDGKTALHLAINNNCVRVVTLLLAAGADAFDCYDNNGKSAYYVATSEPGVTPEIIAMLEKNKPAHNMHFEKAIDLLQNLDTTVHNDPTLNYRERTSFNSAINYLQSLLKNKLPKDFPMPVEHVNILKKSKQLLVDELVPRDVLSVMLTEGILDEYINQEILEEPSRVKQCDKLLEVLIHRGKLAFPVFCKALSLTGQAYILEAMKNEIETALVLSDTAPLFSQISQGRPMLIEHTEFLRLNHQSLMQSMMQITSINVLNGLFSCGILTKGMVKDIQREADTEEKCCKYILDILPKRGRYAFPKFCKLMSHIGEMSDCSIHSSEEM